MSAEIATKSTERNARARVIAAILLIVVLVAYSAAVVLGWIPDGRKIDGVHFALIVLTGLIVVALIQPEAFDRLKRVKLSGFELEVLEKVREKQALQEDQLEDIRLILPLLLPEAARRHLFNLDLGNTSGYQGSHILRGELRRLRSMRLVRMKDGMQISQMKDGSACDLAAFVELTPLGQRWVKRVREIEDAESPAV
jgi:hypothetical protein